MPENTPIIEDNPIGNIEIYSIGVGVVGSGLQYYVGQKLRINNIECSITHIVRDDSGIFSTEESVVYMVFADINGVTKPIKIFVRQPIYICPKI